MAPLIKPAGDHSIIKLQFLFKLLNNLLRLNKPQLMFTLICLRGIKIEGFSLERH